ncbi:hypothetical protein PRIC2_006467 [Phytophthora ramorum]
MEDQSCGSAAAPCAASSASQPVVIETKSEDASVAADPRLSELSRLFIVCGRGRKVDELRALFSTCGAIKHLHLALDRSKKSRGFAFLQYEDPANAAVAIDKLDHLELDDGHILKVTVAKERPVGGKGKLKRDQHARQDQDDKSDGGLGDEDDGVIDARLPGKRQRSSPPVTALPLGPSRVSPAFLLEAPRLEGFGADSVKIKTEMQSGNGLPAVDACKDELMEPDGDEKQVQHVLDAMVAVVEQQQSQSKLSSDLFAAYQHVVSTSDQGGKQNHDNSYGKDRDIKLEFRTEPPEPVRTKVFFTSTYKFTEQELEAMFAVYGDFESVELVKSFGRVKTMAYVRYSKPSTAAFVVKSFREESSQGNECPEKPEFMTLSFAHETTDFQLQQRARLAHFPERALDCSSDLYPSLSGGSTSAPSTGIVMPSSGKDRLWVLLLYDRFLATHMLSSVVSSLSGMEFMDIKVVKSTGEAQGVAFVKFDSEANATQGALQLHQMELPLGSGKFLQAIVILAPSLFTTTHGGNSISNNESMRLDRSADERVVTGSSDDVDLRAVEARFAHLMRSTEHQHSREGSCFPQYSSPRGAAPSDLGHQPPMAAGVYLPSPSAGFHTSMSLSGGMEYYPMQLVTFPPPPPQQPFQPYANFAGPASYQQLPQHPSFVPGWMETSPYYQGGVPQQYPFSCTPEQEMAFPVTNHSSNVADNIDAYAVPPKPRSSRSPSEQMDIEDGNSSCSSQASSSIHVSSSGPLELVTLVTALQDCPGVVSFAKNAAAGSELTGYMVDFSNETQAFEAVRKLDGALCGDQKLRVAKSTSMRHRGGGKSRSGSGRRKRQRVDPRCRK